MNKWKASFFVALISLVITNIFWIIIIVNQGISYSYLKDSYDYETKGNHILQKLILEDVTAYTQKDILSILKKQNPNAFIKIDDNKIYIENMIFEFKDEKLISVK